MDIIVVMLTDPRDGNQLYAVKDMAAFREQVRIHLSDRDLPDLDADDIQLGIRYYDDDGDYIEGYEERLPSDVEVQADG